MDSLSIPEAQVIAAACSSHAGVAVPVISALSNRSPPSSLWYFDRACMGHRFVVERV